MKTQINLFDNFDPDSFGIDLDSRPASDRARFGDAGDLRSTSFGDISTISGPELVVKSRVRELTTPFGYYSRYIQDVEGLKLVDGDYGNALYTLLSEPQSTISMDRVVSTCKDIMLKDTRVSTAEVTPSLNADSGKIDVLITFTLNDGASGSLQFSLNG